MGGLTSDYGPLHIQDILRSAVAATGGGAKYPSVTTFADLPNVADHSGEIYVVLQQTGVIFVNRKRPGLYYSNGTQWKRLGDIVVAASESPAPGFLISNPPVGGCVVQNLYVDPATGKMKVKYEDTPVT